MTGSSLRIAMWSGPRNISTALMRSWGSRPDTFVTDEPLYAHYLATTGREHPARGEVIAHHESDWRKVIDWITGPIPEGRSIWYQKHMTLHLTEEVDRGWLDDVTNCFLIRDPKEVILSYSKVVTDPSPEDLGFPQQAALFEEVGRRTATTPPVLDARRVLEDPEHQLRRLCAALEVPFADQMLSWEPGLRETDGVWAPHWYDNVARSTGFAPYRPKEESLPPRFEALHAVCRKHYERLYEVAI